MSQSTPKTRLEGFRLVPAQNGGWVLTSYDYTAAFTNSVDLLEYLVTELGTVS